MDGRLFIAKWRSVVCTEHIDDTSHFDTCVKIASLLWYLEESIRLITVHTQRVIHVLAITQHEKEGELAGTFLFWQRGQ